MEENKIPEDIKAIFNHLNRVGLQNYHDPACLDMHYENGKNRWLIPLERRVKQNPKQIEEKFQDWYLNDWKNRSVISKIFSILWHLPGHIYRKYFATVDYKWYYNGLVSFVDRARNKWFA